MPDRRRHRGPHPADAKLFAEDALPALRAATADLSWLEGRGYTVVAGLKLVGDRHGLTLRQRLAVRRAAASEEAVARRRAKAVADPRGRALVIDGYNVLTTVEAALAGGLVLAGRDGAFRDLASIHGTFRRVAETGPALEAIDRCLGTLGIGHATWLLDRPVSNSGRLKSFILERTGREGPPCDVELVADPDARLVVEERLIATADAAVLDRCGPFLPLARRVVEASMPEAWIVDLG